MKLLLRQISDDEWGRKRFQNVEDKKRIYADVDGTLHTTSKDGEPDTPLRADLDIKVITEPQRYRTKCVICGRQTETERGTANEGICYPCRCY